VVTAELFPEAHKLLVGAVEYDVPVVVVSQAPSIFLYEEHATAVPPELLS
jgi:hypothetical protein